MFYLNSDPDPESVQSKQPEASGFRGALLTLLGGTLGVMVSLIWLSGSYIDGQYLPMGPDSFLHASRILQAYADIGEFYQWDIQSFAPDGAFNHWPWPYDLICALALKALVPMLGQDPMTLLAYFPTSWSYVTAGLLVLICRQLRMRDRYTLLVLVGYFLLPLSQQTHAVGRIDHDYMEQTFVLASLWLALCWAAMPTRTGRGLALGLCLGLAIGINISMFILQIPVLAIAALRWIQRQPFKGKSLFWFCVALVVSTLAIAAFSEPLQQGYLSYSYLSWFQVYIASCTAAMIFALSYCETNLRNFLGLTGFGLIISIPILPELLGGLGFLATTESSFLQQVSETRSPWAGGAASFTLYSGALLLTPLILICCPVYLVRGQNDAFKVLAIFSVFGLALLLMQYRYNSFGAFALYLPWLCLLDHWQRHRQALNLSTLAASALLVVLCQQPSFTFLLQARQPGFSDIYARTKPLYEYLGKLCEERPGVVLTPLESGNYVRFHTRCSVLGTAQHGADNEQTRLGRRALRLLTLAPDLALKDTTHFDYVLAQRSFGTRHDAPDYAIAFNETGLNSALLGGQGTYPPGFRLLMAAEFERNGQTLGLARLFEVKR